MSHTPHELAEEFPDDRDRLHALKLCDPHVAQLSETYHDVNRRIHRIEALVEPASDAVLGDLKRHRLALKDEIAALLAADGRAVA